MSFGSRMKAKRRELGITQPQLAEMLSVSQSAIASWETDVNSPRATILYDLFAILHCDANYLFQDETHALYKDSATPEEFDRIVKKYRDLDDHGKKLVDTVLNIEYERCSEAVSCKEEREVSGDEGTVLVAARNGQRQRAKAISPDVLDSLIKPPAKPRDI